MPYTLTLVKDAPTIEADAEITDAQEAEIFRYYGGARSSAATATAVASTQSTGTAAGASAAATGLAAGTTGGATTARTAQGNGDIEVPLSEEQIKVGKRTVDAGQVHLRKVVRTEIVNQPVEIRHEDVVVERVAAGEVRSGAVNTDFKEEVIDVPLTREEVVVQKDAKVTGAVRLHKTAETETQTVSETVRKEDVEVVRDGKTAVERDERTKR